MVRSLLIDLSIAAVGCAVGSSVAHAHHSTAMFDDEHPIELAGSVAEWQFENPHCFIILAVTNDDGDTQTWSLEGSSPNVLFRQGWRPDSLRPGDRIVVTVRPLHSGALGGSYRNLRWANGTPVDPKASRPAAANGAVPR
jgi:hypothetical protein